MAKQYPIITLRISIADIAPKIWRRIVVDGDISLRALHHIIQAAFGWSDCHLHDFLVAGTTYAMLDNPYIAEGNSVDAVPMLDDRKAKLHRLLSPKQRFSYQYDFGDSWEHEIEVMHIRQSPEPIGYAEITDGERAGPPEDIGGSYGYANFLTVLRDAPDSEEGQELLAWIGGSFDPEAFDRRMANATLMRMASNRWGGK